MSRNDTVCHVKQPGFAERLAYARMLVHFRTGRCLSNTEIGGAVKRTQPWVTKWARSPTPPRDFEVHRPLASFLGVEEDWLIRDEGKAPESELWEKWLQERGAARGADSGLPSLKLTRASSKGRSKPRGKRDAG